MPFEIKYTELCEGDEKSTFSRNTPAHARVSGVVITFNSCHRVPFIIMTYLTSRSFVPCSIDAKMNPTLSASPRLAEDVCISDRLSQTHG
jgi:hypothetical protein